MNQTDPDRDERQELTRIQRFRLFLVEFVLAYGPRALAPWALGDLLSGTWWLRDVKDSPKNKVKE